MSFYSLVVRDQKRGWFVASQYSKLSTVMNNYLAVSKDAQYRAVILKTSGDVTSIRDGVKFISKCDGKGLARVFSFTHLQPVHTL